MTRRMSYRVISSGLRAELVAAGRPASAVDQPGPLQVEEDLHQEPVGDAVLVGDVGEAHRPRVGVARGQLQHRDTGVLGFGGKQHVPSSKS